MSRNLQRLGEIIAQRHDRAFDDLLSARRLIDHPTEKGQFTENVWLELFKKYLPQRYEVRQGFVVDHLGNLSDQIDIVVHDGLYTPFILEFGGYEILPIESVYAVFEVKQNVNISNMRYAEKKAESVLRLTRAIRPTGQVADLEGTKILTGLLATETAWTKNSEAKILDYRLNEKHKNNLNYIVSANKFVSSAIDGIELFDDGSATISRFLLRFASILQFIGTVKPIDIDRYLDALE